VDREFPVPEIEGDFGVLIIGAGANRPLDVVKSFFDLGGRREMNHMLDHLIQRPEKGLLAYESSFSSIVHYWRSFEHLEAFAKNADDSHLEPCRNSWRWLGKSGRAGTWHETYLDQSGASTKRGAAGCRPRGRARPPT
jgi:hypothetical protein